MTTAHVQADEEPVAFSPKSVSKAVLSSRSVKRPRVLLSLLASFYGVGQQRARYTLAKFRTFDQYEKSTSYWRRTAVVAFAPLPSLITSLLPSVITLQDPLAGALKNTGYMAHFFFTLTLVSFGSVLQFRAPCRISHDDISNKDALLIAVLASSTLLVVVTLIGYVWRFPVPFIWGTGFLPYVSLLVAAHTVVLGRKLRKDGPIRGPLLAFLPSYAVQGLQVVIYPAFSAVYEASDTLGQLVLTLLFPFVKYTFRQVVRNLSSTAFEDTEEVVVSGVEICAAMYQSMIMQTTPSVIATALVIGLDVVQGVFAIYIFMDKKFVVRPMDLVERARTIVQDESRALSELDLHAVASVKKPPRVGSFARRISKARQSTQIVVRQPASVGVSPQQNEGEKIAAKHRRERQVVVQALEIVQSAESILLVEYFEVTVPIVNALFLLWAAQWPSAEYNPKIRPYYRQHSLFGTTMRTLSVYTLLQALSLVVMHLVMWRRFRLSSLTVLAFVLESHAWSLQGKLITWLSIIFQMPVIHYGTDFTLHFDFSLDKSR